MTGAADPGVRLDAIRRKIDRLIWLQAVNTGLTILVLIKSLPWLSRRARQTGSGWRRERMPRLLETWDHAIAPDWVCEVLDPADRAAARSWKRDTCAEHGVGFLWHVDVEERVLEAFRRDGFGWTLAGTLRDDAEVRLPPFEAHGWPLAALWEV